MISRHKKNKMKIFKNEIKMKKFFFHNLENTLITALLERGLVLISSMDGLTFFFMQAICFLK